MLHGPVPARLQDIVEADQIARDIRIGIRNRIPHASLRSQVHHHLWLIGLEDAVDGFLRRDVALDETELRLASVADLPDLLQPPLLQAHVIVIVHIVDTDDRCPFQVVLQPFHQVAADESRSSCHQDGLTIQINLLHKRTYQLYGTNKTDVLLTQECVETGLVEHLLHTRIDA